VIQIGYASTVAVLIGRFWSCLLHNALRFLGFRRRALVVTFRWSVAHSRAMSVLSVKGVFAEVLVKNLTHANALLDSTESRISPLRSC
jgi:hypothetical protein